VDLLDFPQIDFRRRFFDSAEAELASQGLACLEIDARPLLTLEGADRIRLLSSLRREAATAADFHVPIVLSSGVSESIHVRKPMELAAMSSLFGLTGNLAADAVSANPSAIIRRNRDKLSPKFVAPGIRLVRKGKDC
jgi:RNase P/RNase MRP subunit p30